MNMCKTFHHYMWEDHGSAKLGMNVIVEKYASQTLQEYYRSRGHNALIDAKSLCTLTTVRGMFHRFFSSHALDKMRDAPESTKC